MCCDKFNFLILVKQVDGRIKKPLLCLGTPSGTADFLL